MASTDIAKVAEGGYLALNHATQEIQDILAANLDGQEVGEFDLKRLTVPSGGGTAWEIETLTGPEHIKEITGIIVHKKRTRAFWPVALGDGESGPPSCSSADGKVGYGKQWATAEDPDPDGDPRRLACADCPLSKFGTGKNGGQACQEKHQWFLLTETGFMPIVVTLPAMSIKAATGYLLNLGDAMLRFDQVATKLTLEKIGSGGAAYSKVKPALGGVLTPEEAERARAYGALLAPIFDRVAAADTPSTEDSA